MAVEFESCLSPYVLNTSTRQVDWQISLDPFGETVSENTPVISDNLRFPGQLADRGSLLNYNWHRYYQPKIGRYYQVDPEFSLNSINPYVYVKSNPLILTDKTGQQIDGTVGAFLKCLFETDRFLALVNKSQNRINNPYTCASLMRYVATSVSRSIKDIDESPTKKDGMRDAYKHCSGSCLVEKICPGGIAFFGGLGKEIIDPFSESGDVKTRLRRFDMGIRNNTKGRVCGGRGFCQSCFDCCLQKLNNGELTYFR